MSEYRSSAIFLVLVGPLLGIVFAGFALVVSLLSDEHLRWLNESKNGIVSFLSPFMVAIGMQVGVLIAGVTYRAIARELPSQGEEIFFLVLAFLFVFAAFDLVALARNIFAHGLLRAGNREIQDIDEARRRRQG